MLAFIKKHKIGIIVTIGVHLLLIAYFSIGTIEKPLYNPKSKAIIEFDFTEEVKEEELGEKELSKDERRELIKNLRRDINDSRKKSNESYSEEEIEAELEQKYKDLEQKIIDERAAQGKGFDASQYNTRESKDDNKEKSDSKTKKEKGETQAAGRVATSCDIPGRNCSPKTPAYTCPQYKDGKIVVDIKVNQKGRVTSAKINKRESTSSYPCFIEQSLKYAKRLKANQDFSAPNSQSGSIEFNFIGG